MRIAITGSSGLIGSALVRALHADGHNITPLVRRASSSGVLWDPATQQIDLDGLEGIDAMIHLAGESIAGLWTHSKKQRIRESRVQGTKLIATSLAKLRRAPEVLVSASAIGYYGDRSPGDAIDESGAKGTGFLADVVQDWEAAAVPASTVGIRVVHPRLGLVLAREGGSLGAVLPIFKAGLGGRIGSGRQIWSWVAIDDVVAGIMACLTTHELRGPVNVVAPLAVTNLAFTRTLGRVLRRPTIFPVPAAVLKTVGGDMARELLLSGARVVPRKLQEAGYAFKYPELEGALRHVLGQE